MTVKFEKVKDKLVGAIDERKSFLGFTEPEGLTLVDGFFNSPFQKEMSSSFVIGGPSLPMIAVVGNKTGRVYFFAVKALMPDVENYAEE